MAKRQNNTRLNNSIIERIDKLQSKFYEVDTFLKNVLNNLKKFGDSWHLMLEPMTQWAWTLPDPTVASFLFPHPAEDPGMCGTNNTSPLR